MNRHAILDAIQDGILVIDKQGIVKKINNEYTRITGVCAQDIIGKPLLEIRPEAQLVSTLKDKSVRVGVYRKVNGREYLVDMAPIFDGDQVVGAVSICKGKQEVLDLTKTIEQQKQQIQWLQQKVEASFQAAHHFESIIGYNQGLKEVTAIARKAATAPFPVLITGESGTGKELFAQAIHRGGKNASQPFVPINCAAIPTDLLESELFGYETGAFTGAQKNGKLGLFELADNGTLFLDEIGELPLSLQSKLLRVLQEGTIRRLGALKEKRVCTRIIAATNQNLADLVSKGLFREDLYYRLCVFQLHIPPLRERKEDIPLLAKTLLASQSDAKAVGQVNISDEALERLKHYHWPGNVRELKNALQFALCMMDEPVLHPSHLPPHLATDQWQRSTPMSFTPPTSLKAGLEEAERQLITNVLANCDNHLEGKKQAAKRLNISLATLYNKMKKHRL